MPQFTTVGRSIRRAEGMEKVTGKARFTADLDFPGLLEGRVLRSPFPHALIESIDVRDAEALPGVYGVLTRESVRDIDPYYGHCLRDRPLIATERVRYVGEPVVAVAAESGDIAAEALALVRVRYRELPMAATVDDALAPDAPVLHDTNALAGEYHELAALEEEAPRNVCHHERLESGDVAAGFAQADAVFEDTFEFPMICHYSLEPHTAVARFEGDEIALWTSSAHPFLIRAEIAQMFRVPMPNVRVTVPYVGGAFGGKSYFKIEPLAVALARTAGGRPVRLAQSASESMLTIRRHSARCRVRTGVRRDGTVVAREAELHLDTGAYADNGPRVAKRVATRIHGPYRIPHYRIDVYAVYTNTAPAGSMRSIGGPQSIFPLESHMDGIARGLDLDPLAFRLKNLLRPNEELKPGAKPMDADLHMDLHKLASMVDWDENQGPPADNLGIAVGVTDSEAMPVSTAILRLLSDGSVVLMAGSTEVGQGARTVLSQVAAEGLRLPPERIVMRATNTDVTPFDRSTGASRSTTVMGTAVKFAAEDLLEQIRNAAAEVMGVEPAAVTCEAGWAQAPGKAGTSPGATENIVDVDGRALRTPGQAGPSSGAPPVQRMDYGAVVRAFFAMPGGEFIGRGYVRAGGGIPAQFPVFWETGMGAAAVDVDEETGEVRVPHYASVADVGKAINRLQAEAQDEGAAMMGMGHTLCESLLYDGGQPLNPNLIDYKVPGFADMPRRFEIALTENQDGPGPWGAKGMGESGIVAVAPAVANAIARLTGVRIRELPLTPERVWRALSRRARGQHETCRSTS